MANLAELLAAFFEISDVAGVPVSGTPRHPLRTDGCPPLTRFASGVEGGWTEAELKHVSGCLYCLKTSELRRSMSNPGLHRAGVVEGRTKAVEVLASATAPEMQDRIAGWVRSQIDFLASSVRVVAGKTELLSLATAATVPAALGDSGPGEVVVVGGEIPYALDAASPEITVVFTAVRRRGVFPKVLVSGAHAADTREVPVAWDEERNACVARFATPAADYVIVITPGW